MLVLEIVVVLVLEIVVVLVLEIVVVLVLEIVVVVLEKILFHPTMGGVTLRLGALPEPWKSNNTSKD